jgi:hypothetical protein
MWDPGGARGVRLTLRQTRGNESRWGSLDTPVARAPVATHSAPAFRAPFRPLGRSLERRNGTGAQLERSAHRDDDLPLCVASLQIREGLGDLGEGKDLIDDHLELLRLDEGGEHFQILPARPHE